MWWRTRRRDGLSAVDICLLITCAPLLERGADARLATKDSELRRAFASLREVSWAGEIRTSSTNESARDQPHADLNTGVVS